MSDRPQVAGVEEAMKIRVTRSGRISALEIGMSIAMKEAGRRWPGKRGTFTLSSVAADDVRALGAPSGAYTMVLDLVSTADGQATIEGWRLVNGDGRVVKEGTGRPRP